MNRNRIWYTIGLKAAELMSDKKHPLMVEDVIPILDDWASTLPSKEAGIFYIWEHKNKKEMRTISGKEHAVKCYIPGTCNSSSLIIPWPTMAPFTKVSSLVLQRSLDEIPGYQWSTMVCDYFSSVKWRDEMMTEEMYAEYLTLKQQEKFKNYLRFKFPYVTFRKT